MTTSGFLAMVCIVAALLLGASGEQCGDQANGTLCPNNLCCSEYGWCGVTPAYCCQNCQSQCNCPSPPPPSPSPPPPTPTPPSPGGGGVADIISASLFEEMLKNRNDPNCPAKGFYTYTAFIAAANSFAGFGTTGDMDIRKREIAAFLGQTSQETTGWWAGQPYAWGYCFKEEINPSFDYCVSNNQWPCVAGQSYHGRGPIQLSYNYNYGPAGKALELDLLSNPSLVSTNPLVSFETAIWFWMTPQYNKPSAHDVIIGRWIPSDNDLRANRLPGYGVITNIINGGLECGHGPDQRVFNRIGYYKRYCDMLGVDYGDNLDCYNQTPFGVGHAEFQQLQTF